MSGDSSGDVSTVWCGDKQLSFACDWGVGIGGALWSTGLELVQHFQMFPALYASVFRGKTVVELGTGTGLVGLAVAAMFEPVSVILTDNQEHLPIINHNIELNAGLLHRHNKSGGEEAEAAVVATCQLLDWNKPEEFDAGGQIDVIIATDVVYNKSLYDIFISTLLCLCSPTSVVIMGVTRTDTDRGFFDKLTAQGFTYRKIPEHSCPKDFRSTNFGLFIVQRRSS